MTSLIIGLGDLPAKSGGLALATRIGTPIPNEQRLERAPEAKEAAIEIWKDRFPKITFRSIVTIYNCVGLVFASRRTCVDTGWLLRILYEDDYRKLKSEAELQTGDVVVYKDAQGTPQHTGFVIEVVPDISNGTWNISVMSQWGADGEYIHSLLDVPNAYGTPEFWTERKKWNEY